MKTKREVSLFYSTILVIVVVAIISVGMIVFDASIQLMMLIAMFALVPFVMYIGFTYKDIEKMMFSMMSKTLNPILIIIAVGALIGAWILSGTVPAMIYYGLQLVSPSLFLVTSLIFCSIVSLGTGTSFGAMGTAGLALIGMGEVLGVSPGLTAGAIISGAYFGDKMSPLSDSTNITAAMAGANLFSHIKHMLWTTTPAYILTAIIFAFFDMGYSGTAAAGNVQLITNYLSEEFNLGVLAFLPLLVLVILLALKKPAVTSIFIAAMAGAILAVLYQGETITNSLNTIYNGYGFESGIDQIDSLLQRGGVTSMLGIVGLFLFALGVGGLLQGSGALSTILKSFETKIKSVKGLVVSTVIVSYITVALSGVISFAAAITGTLMRPMFKDYNLKPENLSRIIEDTATQSAVLFPWSINSIFAAATLGVSTFEFMPYCFLAFLTPIFTLIYGFTGFKMKEYEPNELKDEMKEELV